MDKKKTIRTATRNDHNTSHDQTSSTLSTTDLLRHPLCKISDLQNGQMKEFEIKIPTISASVLLIKQNNKFYAYGSKCCHYKLSLAKGVLVDNHIRCFAHGACFRVDTGDIEDHPGHGSLPKFDVELMDDQVILIAQVQELTKLERTKIPNNLMVESKPIVAIIGAGAAGYTCADMLRQYGFRGRVVMFTSESILPYDRVQLSKQPSKNLQDILLRDESYFQTAKIDVLLNTEVTKINWSTKILIFKGLNNCMKSLAYDYLVLATGLQPRQLPSSLSSHTYENIYYLRTYEDASKLANQAKLPDVRNIVIIGDSFIALELCGWLTTSLNEKKTVSIVMRSKFPMMRIFGEKIGEALQKIHENNGATFYSKATLLNLRTKNNLVEGVKLTTGDLIPCDLVIVAIGSEICNKLYQNSPIEMTDDGFIKVNQHLQTSVDQVLAIGDISKYPLGIFNLSDVNCQHWQMACITGHQAAITILRNFLGQAHYDYHSSKANLYTTPIFWTTQNNKTIIRYVGYTRDPENVIIHGDLDNELKFVAYYIVDGYVRAVAQSKYDPLSAEIAEIFYYKRNIRKEDIENDMFGYKKYLTLDAKNN